MSTSGHLKFQGTNRATFVGTTSNIMFDTTTTSLGIGVTGTDHPSSNLYITGNAYVSSNIAVGGVLTMGTVNVVARHDLESVTATGNITPLTVEFTNPTTSLVASGNVVVTGNVTADHFVGDGSNITGISSTLQAITDSGPGANVTSNTVQFSNAITSLTATSNIVVTGNVTAGSFLGDGSELTALNAANIASGTLPVARGGTGTTSSTGTGALVLQNAPSFTGDATFNGGVTMNRFMGSGNGAFSGSGAFNLPFSLNYGFDDKPHIGWEIHLAFGFSGTNYGTFYIQGAEDSSGSIVNVGESNSVQLRDAGANWSNPSSTPYLTANRETVAPTYYAIIRIVQAVETNIATGSSTRWHFQYQCTGCHAGVGATTYFGSGYFQFPTTSRRINKLRLNCDTGSVSGNYYFVAIS